jgi:diadenosine tetraphosphate (Ap4A) HIT family hydrolase
MVSIAEACEFCAELTNPQASRFGAMYGSVLRSRVVRETSSFVVVPTVGQMFPGSMLVIPRKHIETLAGFGLATDGRATDELISLMDSLNAELSQFGDVVSFEHGARADTGASCGIYHAHLHCVPTPRVLRAEELLPRGQQVRGFGEGLRMLADASQYLIVRDSKGVTRLHDQSHGAGEYGSQYFRRRIAQVLDAPVEWDWRTYVAPEPFLLETVAAFRE